MTLNRSFEAMGAAVLTLFVAAGCSAPEKAGAPAAARGAATAVATAGSMPEVYETTGTLRARTTSNLASKVMGNVTAVLVREGDRVRAGQLLLRIDPREASAQLDRARAGAAGTESAIAAATAGESAAAANAALADATLARYKVLRERNSVSPHEFEQVEAQQKAAAAELDRARAALSQLRAQRSASRAELETASTFASYTEIRSPIDGVVTAKLVDPGSQAAPGMVLLTVEDTTATEVEVFVDEAVAGRVRAGDTAEVEIASVGTMPGRVANVVPALDASTHSALVKVAIEPKATLRSGQLARVRLAIGERQAIAVPSFSIVKKGQLDAMYVVDSEGTVQMRIVKPGRSFGDRTEILSGIDDGERYVTAPTAEISDGVRIAAATGGAQ